ncbi:hypothetical protein [Streptomyces sp. NBC_00209]|uniref:hypothetical protein n=1 Tax=Streptomyces sp. NBC_00209 TaxID=2975682 RepID=UPI00324FA838
MDITLPTTGDVRRFAALVESGMSDLRRVGLHLRRALIEAGIDARVLAWDRDGTILVGRAATAAAAATTDLSVLTVRQPVHTARRHREAGTCTAHCTGRLDRIVWITSAGRGCR